MKPVVLTRWFTKLARKIDLYDGWDISEIPTFHEIRGLGSHLLESVEKRDIKDIQQLMAHSTDKQTKVYLDGHGEKWVEAEAGNTTLW